MMMQAIKGIGLYHAGNDNHVNMNRIAKGIIVPGKRQASVPHSRASSLSPSQSAPPSAGCGLVHVRVRTCSPPSQVAEQVPNDVHSDHWPSTTMQNGWSVDISTY